MVSWQKLRPSSTNSIQPVSFRVPTPYERQVKFSFHQPHFIMNALFQFFPVNWCWVLRVFTHISLTCDPAAPNDVPQDILSTLPLEPEIIELMKERRTQIMYEPLDMQQEMTPHAPIYFHPQNLPRPNRFVLAMADIKKALRLLDPFNSRLWNLGRHCLANLSLQVCLVQDR